ncbi:hypothetical protein HELRODRAFT_176568 [Helobdella robusta]|uniref:Uncharacterized protein n=1 Tax=Helobdella robusta TaxID=6412 RepID=T1FAN7_HELRO|nr:hypothetical protein HELRODRAFT_176568 [Helobdella robusta]ESN99801.1 hypothetical protein HELRODRAFT_176568 [Helobdella robusta]
MSAISMSSLSLKSDQQQPQARKQVARVHSYRQATESSQAKFITTTTTTTIANNVSSLSVSSLTPLATSTSSLNTSGSARRLLPQTCSNANINTSVNSSSNSAVTANQNINNVVNIKNINNNNISSSSGGSCISSNNKHFQSTPNLLKDEMDDEDANSLKSEAVYNYKTNSLSKTAVKKGRQSIPTSTATGSDVIKQRQQIVETDGQPMRRDLIGSNSSVNKLGDLDFKNSQSLLDSARRISLPGHLIGQKDSAKQPIRNEVASNSNNLINNTKAGPSIKNNNVSDDINNINKNIDKLNNNLKKNLSDLFNVTKPHETPTATAEIAAELPERDTNQNALNQSAFSISKSHVHLQMQRPHSSMSLQSRYQQQQQQQRRLLPSEPITGKQRSDVTNNNDIINMNKSMTAFDDQTFKANNNVNNSLSINTNQRRGGDVTDDLTPLSSHLTNHKSDVLSSKLKPTSTTATTPLVVGATPVTTTANLPKWSLKSPGCTSAIGTNLTYPRPPSRTFLAKSPDPLHNWVKRAENIQQQWELRNNVFNSSNTTTTTSNNNNSNNISNNVVDINVTNNKNNNSTDLNNTNTVNTINSKAEIPSKNNSGFPCQSKISSTEFQTEKHQEFATFKGDIDELIKPDFLTKLQARKLEILKNANIPHNVDRKDGEDDDYDHDGGGDGDGGNDEEDELLRQNLKLSKKKTSSLSSMPSSVPRSSSPFQPKNSLSEFPDRILMGSPVANRSFSSISIQSDESRVKAQQPIKTSSVTSGQSDFNIPKEGEPMKREAGIGDYKRKEGSRHRVAFSPVISMLTDDQSTDCFVEDSSCQTVCKEFEMSIEKIIKLYSKLKIFNQQHHNNDTAATTTTTTTTTTAAAMNRVKECMNEGVKRLSSSLLGSLSSQFEDLTLQMMELGKRSNNNNNNNNNSGGGNSSSVVISAKDFVQLKQTV